jgi:LacI family transcriptional regulator
MENLTLEKIAKLAGVSRSTVSRVVNAHPSVRPHVRQKVLEIIAETGYHPHAAARSLASNRSNIIGLVFPRSVHAVFTDPYFPHLTQGISQACNQHDYMLSLFLFHTKEEERNLFPRICRKGVLGGVILQVGQLENESIAQLSANEIPFIVAGRPSHANQVSYIDVDNVDGAYRAVTHLIRLGNSSIGTIAGALDTTAGLDRLHGYERALAEHGLPLDDSLVADGGFTESGAYEATRRVLSCTPDALFVASDVMAVGAMRALRDAQLSVPRDVALVGFDDLPPALSAVPPLTTVRQPVQQMGFRAVEVLLDIIQNGTEPPRQIVLGTELVIRASCGANARS